ncbi:ATP-dependent DEAD/H DNA-helicase recQ family-like protein [Sesbania bispinosa]|nr:ATP-dependent DEAD/H DNA-helicase recQ family-like protein [Sesbania bispinosa]
MAEIVPGEKWRDPTHQDESGKEQKETCRLCFLPTVQLAPSLHPMAGTRSCWGPWGKKKETHGRPRLPVGTIQMKVQERDKDPAAADEAHEIGLHKTVEDPAVQKIGAWEIELMGSHVFGPVYALLLKFGSMDQIAYQMDFSPCSDLTVERVNRLKKSLTSHTQRHYVLHFLQFEEV